MPLETEEHDVTEERPVCPDCGHHHVTPMEDVQTPNPSDVIVFGDQDEVTYKNVCWNCGWIEHVTMTLEREVSR